MNFRFQIVRGPAISKLGTFVGVTLIGLGGSLAQAQDYWADHPNNVRRAQQPAGYALTDPSSQQPAQLVSHATMQVQSAAATDSLSLTLDQAIGMALQNNTGIQLANANIRAKAFATDIARADYYPQVDATAGAFELSEELGKVLRVGGAGGPEEVGIVDKNVTWGGIIIAQPITQLLVIKQAVQLAEADRRIAQAQLQGGQRDLAFGVTQLYYGLLAAQQGQQAAQLQIGAAGASTDQATARIAALQAQTALAKAQGQVTALQQQLNSILCVPLDTQLALVEPPLPDQLTVDIYQAVESAVNCSPEVREAREGIAKACAAIKIAKLDYVPVVDAVGGYIHQNALNIISENDFSFVGVTASLPILSGGKRRSTMCERETQMAMAKHNVCMVEQKTRLAAQKVCRDYEGSVAALNMAHEVLKIRQEAAKQATGAAASGAAAAEKAAQIDVMKAEIGYRLAHSQMMSVIEGNGAPQTPK